MSIRLSLLIFNMSLVFNVMAQGYKPNDYLVAKCENPQFGASDFNQVGLTTENTQFMPRNWYEPKQFVQKRFTVNGTFDKELFYRFYSALTREWNRFCYNSTFEFVPIKSIDFPLFNGSSSHFTDDTIMTIANADWLLTGDSLLGIMQDYGNRYHSSYGSMFYEWLREENPQPYGSWGNGSAMRVSPIGWAFDTLEETLDTAKRSAEVTHNHPEGIKGAQATATCIYLARTGKTKQEIKEYIETTFDYNLSRTCEEIRPTYHFNESCQGTVPESIIAFLESTDYESAIRLTISLGGDADTMGAITGGIAEAYYKEIPEHITEGVIKRLPDEFIDIMQRFYGKFIEK